MRSLASPSAPGFPGALHPDVAVSVDEGGGDDRKPAKELTLGLHGGAPHGVPLEQEVNFRTTSSPV